MESRVAPPHLVEIIVLASLLALAGCGGGGGGSGGRMVILTASAESGPLLPWDGVHLNERIVLRFSAEVDPSSVSPDTIQIRLVSSGFSIAAKGRFSVRGSEVSFVPDVPARPDLTDAGFGRLTEYRVFVPDSPPGNTVRSRSGARIAERFSVNFSTRGTEPFFVDSLPGPPEVILVAVDLDRNGVLEADGNPATPDLEEFPSFDELPFLREAPVGLARAPLLFGLFFDEPLDPASVFLDEVGLLPSPGIRLRAADSPVPFLVELFQRYDPALDRTSSLVVVRPRTTLPGTALVELSIGPELQDLGFPPVEAAAVRVAIETRSGPASFEDALVQRFDDTVDRDPSTTAGWNLADSGVLIAGSEIGGSGVDGRLILPENRTTFIDTTDNGGLFQFEEVLIPAGATLRAAGPHLLRILCQNDVTILGTLLVDGMTAENAVMGSAARVAPGAGGALGGGAGGNANDPPGEGVDRGLTGESPEGFEGAGGQGGKRSFTGAGGGGGGGHATEGLRDPFANSGLGGAAIADEMLETPAGGGGGGGGGNARGANPGVDSPGGGGGAGGGVLVLRCGGTLRIGAQDLPATISADGGNGGGGAGPGPAGSSGGGGGGGGGAGGALKIQAVTIADIVQSGTEITAAGGRRGDSPQAGGARPGADGAPGRILIDALDADRNGEPDDFRLDMTAVNVDPFPKLGILDEGLLRRSVARSNWLDTGTASPRYSFDATFPGTGLLRDDEKLADLVLVSPLPEGASIRVQFCGTNEDPENRGQPDPAGATELVSDISLLDGHRFLRYVIEFDRGPEHLTVPPPAIEEVSIRFAFDI